MNAELNGPAGEVPRRRRSSTVDSTGLDYTSCHRVDEDIFSRVRSLLLSRNEHRPPRTPFPSDEKGRHFSEPASGVDKFDFSPAKSISKRAREEKRQLKIQGSRRELSKSDQSVMGSGRRTRPSLSGLRFSLPPLRNASSTSDINGHSNSVILLTEPPCCPSSPQNPPSKPKKRFGFPRLVLQDKKTRNDAIKSCVEISSDIPQNDAEIHKNELNCYPPCDPPNNQSSKYSISYQTQWPGRNIRTEPGDLACFLAGCAPDDTVCKKHHARRQSITHREPMLNHRIGDDFEWIVEGQDVSKLWKEPKTELPTMISGANDGHNTEQGSEDKSTSVYHRSNSFSAQPKLPAWRNLRSPSDPSASSSATSTSDVFPLAYRSLELAANEALPLKFSTTVATNFSLPGYKQTRSSTNNTARKRSVNLSRVNLDTVTRIPNTEQAEDSIRHVGRPKQLDALIQSEQINSNNSTWPGKLNLTVAEDVLPQSPETTSRFRNSFQNITCVTVQEPFSPAMKSKQSNTSLRSRLHSPSLLSGASRSSINRHALLKPSVKDAQPVDTGLPVPPVLSPISGISGLTIDNDDLLMVVEKSEGPFKGNTLGDGQLEADIVRGEAQEAQGPSSDQNDCAPPDIKSSHLDKASTNAFSHPPSSLVKGKALIKAPQAILYSPSSEPRHNHPICDMDESLSAASKALSTSIPAPKEVHMGPQDMNINEPPPPDMLLKGKCWGFSPKITEAVQDAVQVAVRNAVHEIIIPSGSGRNDASQAYRKLVADSLTEAAKQADDYLRRPSLWNDSEGTVIRSGRSLTGSRQNCDEAELSLSIPEADASPEIVFPPGDPCEGFGQGEIAVQEPVPRHEMRYIPPNQSGSTLSENDKNAWKSSSGWRGGPSVICAPVPDRNSSRNRISGPKPKATNNNSFTDRRSFERLVQRESRALRSISSEASLKGSGSAKKNLEEETLLVPDQNISRRYEHSSGSQIMEEEKHDPKSTVHWLRTLLPSSGSYEPQFTALPPRAPKEKHSLSRTRPQAKSGKPVSEFSLGATPKALASDLVITKPATSYAKHDRRGDPSATFTKTINDLENLMNEALIIARQAVDDQNGAYAPRVFGDATKILKNSRKVESDDLRAKSKVITTWSSDNISGAPSIHESMRSYSSSSASDYSNESGNDEEQRRFITVSITKPSKNPSGWPPTGRSSTPYPPASLPTSSKSRSPPADLGPVGENDIGYETFNQIKAADPRSMPTENHLGSPGNNASALPLESMDTFSGENNVLIEPGPEFRTLEPFSTKATGDWTRKSSEKSPRRLTPTKKGRGEYERITATNPKNTIPGGSSQVILPLPTPHNTSPSERCIREAHSEEEHQVVKLKLAARSVPNKQEVRDYILEHYQPPIHLRESSLNLKKGAKRAQEKFNFTSDQSGQTGQIYDSQNVDCDQIKHCVQPQTRGSTSGVDLCVQERNTKRFYSDSMDGSHSEALDFNTGYGVRQRSQGSPGGGREQGGVELRDNPNPDLPQTNKATDKSRRHPAFSLRGKTHVSLNEHHHKGFSLARSNKRRMIARDWSPGRKRFVATVACVGTMLIGILVGIYAGETPAIQYYIVDLHHYTVLGNVFFFIGLSIPTFLFWPLPLLHGRKPYILGSMSLAMPLLFPQALSVGSFRSPYISTWRVALIMSRALMGICLGFANMNFKGMLMDLFGASLQSTNPHQEHVDEFDVRRHGGGMGVWLGLWTWSALGSIGFGFLIGAVIINTLSPAWGFYISITIIAFVMLLNVLCPEVRRSAYRRSVAEVINGESVSRRLARGEVKMHMVQSGPKWWGEEFLWGVILSLNMLRQPGFMVMALYVAWIYGQQVLIIVLLGALTSKDYKFKSPLVGVSVLAIPLGALLAIPFQKASLLSRARGAAPVTDDATLAHKVKWTSHMIRRAIFILVLPFAGLGYTLTSSGPPIPFILPILFAGAIGFLSNLAMAECHGIIMETFDTSDLQPGMTGRPRGSSGDKSASKRTNYSSFPRVASAFAITQGLGYLIAAAASGVGGVLTRHLGAQAATGIMAGILLILSLMLLSVLVRFTEVQIIPDSRKEEMERYHNARRTSAMRRADGLEEEEPWRPVIIGNPHHITRRMCLLELGSMSRFSEIRKKNRLVDDRTLEAKHPNRAAFEAFESKIKEKELEVVHHVRRSLSRGSSRGSRRSKYDGSDIIDPVPEQRDLGGLTEMGPRVSGNGLGRGRGFGKQKDPRKRVAES